MIPPELQAMIARLDEHPTPTASLREVLRWFGLPSLTVTASWEIQRCLEGLGVLTVPPLSGARLDTPLEFRRNGPPPKGSERTPPPPRGARAQVPGHGSLPTPTAAPKRLDVEPRRRAAQVADPEGGTTMDHVSRAGERPVAPPARSEGSQDATVRIHQLGLRSPPVSIGPDEPLSRAHTLLSVRGVPWLAVLKSERSPCGVIGWRQLADAPLFPSRSEVVRDHVVRVDLCSLDDALSDVLPQVEVHGAVLVQNQQRQVVALLSLEDVHAALRRFNVPSLLLAEIESRLHSLVQTKIPEEMAAAQKRSGPTLGDYVRWLGHPDLWERLELPLDRQQTVKALDEVRGIRNRHAHHETPVLGEAEVRLLQHFLRTLRVVTPL